jgi:hypothetical protein
VVFVELAVKMARQLALRMLVSMMVMAMAMVSLQVVPAHGLYMELQEGSQKCFIEEVPKDTLVLTTFEMEQLLSPGEQPDARFATLGMRISVRDPSNAIILHRELPTTSRFAFTSRLGGEHHICFQTNTTRWFGSGMKLKFSLDIDNGAQAVDYEEVARVEHLDNLEMLVRRLNDRVRASRKEIAYQKQREEEHRDTSESTNARVMWWSILQTVLLTASGLFQIYHLKRFLHRRIR